MIIYIDIDETICKSPDKPYYNTSVPITDNINKANKLFDDGHTIIYWTARGQTTGIDWSELTVKQLKEWGVKYTDVKLDKPHYDLFIDDKNMNTTDWTEETVNKLMRNT